MNMDSPHIQTYRSEPTPKVVNNGKLRPRFCPICGVGNLRAVSSQPAKWSYERCDGCGHLCLSPMPSDLELREYYNNAYQVRPDWHELASAREYLPVSRALKPRQAGTMLEIGCSYGGMLARFRTAGWDVEGVELDDRAAQFAREHHGLLVRTGTLESVRPLLREQYDVVTLYHVIEQDRKSTRLNSSHS